MVALTDSKSDSSVDLSSLFGRIRNGDRTARDQFIGSLYDRIVRLTSVLLRTFPDVRINREVESVTNDLVIKLMKALEDPALKLSTEGDFFRLAAHKLRLLLIDEADKYRRRNAVMNRPGCLDGGPLELRYDPGTDSLDPATLAIWTEFWAKVAELPADELTVFEMHFLMNMPQSEIARVLGWEPKQVSRLWLKACMKLADYMPTAR